MIHNFAKWFRSSLWTWTTSIETRTIGGGRKQNSIKLFTFCELESPGRGLWIETMNHHPMFVFPNILAPTHLQIFLTHTLKTRKIRSKYFIDFSGRFYASMKNEKIVEEKIAIKKSSSVYMQRFPPWILRTCDVAVKISIDKEVLWLFRFPAAISSFVKAKLHWKRQEKDYFRGLTTFCCRWVHKNLK